MDLLKVSKDDFEVGNLVEGWRTLIWTERFQPWGDFELHTEDIDYTRDILPERSLCTLRDTDEVMIVDTHNVKKNDNGVPELIIKGRTIDSFLTNRVWKNAPYGKTVKMQHKYTIKEAAAVWVWNAVVNDTGDDVIRNGETYPAGNSLPHVIVTVSMPAGTDDGSVKARKIQNGVVYDQLMTFLSSGKLGIRIIRPNGTKGRKVNVGSGGAFSTDAVADITNLRFDIYKGRDLTDDVVFSWRAGHLENPEYMFSSETLKTGAYVVGDPRNHYYTDPDVLPGTNTGWNRRDTFVDGGSKDDLTQGGSESDAAFAARKAAAADDFEESLEDLGLRAVRKEGAHINTVDAQISPFINFKYNVDYRLGDRVKVQGEYGSDNKWVTEFIRTEDSNGEVGYPTLSSKLS